MLKGLGIDLDKHDKRCDLIHKYRANLKVIDELNSFLLNITIAPDGVYFEIAHLGVASAHLIAGNSDVSRPCNQQITHVVVKNMANVLMMTLNNIEDDQAIIKTQLRDLK